MKAAQLSVSVFDNEHCNLKCDQMPDEGFCDLFQSRLTLDSVSGLYQRAPSCIDRVKFTPMSDSNLPYIPHESNAPKKDS